MDIGNQKKYPCACCGYLVNRYPPGYHEVCPICGWEDDLSQLRFADMPGSSNHVSLVEAQINYSAYGAAERRNKLEAREPVNGEEREHTWRPIDRKKDNLEYPKSGIDYKNSYPQDSTVLYYWRPSYWRRMVS